MKTRTSTYKKDKYYEGVVAAVGQLLADHLVITPVEILMQMGYLSKEDYENWRFGRISYLERVIKLNLSKANRILNILRLHAQERGLSPSHTEYMKWGKGPKIHLRFSKTGHPAIEELYSMHYVVKPDIDRKGNAGT